MAKKKKKLRLKSSVRRTIASLLMITAIIIAAIPAPKIQAEGDEKLEFRDEKSTYGLDRDIVYYFSIDSGSNAYLQGYSNWDDDSSNYSSKDSITSLTIPSHVLLDPDNNGEREYTVVGVVSCENGGKLNSVRFNGDTVKYISDGAFKNSTGLNEIIFPRSLETIGNSAFQGCTNLTKEISIPSSVRTIGSDCFNGSGVTSVVFNTTALETLQDGIFKNTEITNVTFNTQGIETIGNEAFLGCSKLQNLTLPDGITTISSKAFYDCNELISISLPSSVTTIGEMAFAECPKLQKVEGLKDTKISAISNSLFYDDSDLTAVLLPTTCTSIGNDAFYQCSGLETVVIPYSIVDLPDSCFSYATGLKLFLLGNRDANQNPQSASEIADYVYAYSSRSAKDCTVNNAITPGPKLHVYAFAVYDDKDPSDIYDFCQKNADITFHDLGDGGNTTQAQGIKIDKNTGMITYVDPLQNTESGLKINEEVNGVTVQGISRDAFPVGSNYTSIELPKSCTKIEDYAFVNCQYLTSLIGLADQFTEVGTNALLNGNSGLKVTGNISADNALFRYAMNNPVQDEYGNEFYLPFSNVDYDTKGYTLTVQKKKALDGNMYATLVGYQAGATKNELTIPSGIEKINLEYDTFLSNNNDLEKLVIEENGITELDDYQFLGDENLREVTLPGNLTRFGSSDGKPPFTGCTSLAKITFTGGSNFSCDDYGVITGPDSKGNANAKIYEGLEGNPSLNDYSTGSNITEIDKYAFYRNPYITGIDFSASSGLTTIPENAFSDCQNLSSIKFGSKISSVGELAFANAGTPTSKDKAVINVDVDNPSIKYNNKPFDGNKKGEREYHFYGTNETNDASHILCDQSDIDGLIWGGTEPVNPDDFNDDNFKISTGPALTYSDKTFTATLKPRGDTNLSEGNFNVIDRKGLIVSTDKYKEKDNGWTITVDKSAADKGYVEFRAYGDGQTYDADGYVTGKYPIKTDSGGGGGGGGGGTVSGDFYYVDELKPDIFDYKAYPVEPDLTVRLIKNPLTILTENKDYYVDYKNNYYPGTATAVVKGINKYEGANDASIDFQIKKNIAECPLEVENAGYTGQLVQPTVHVFDYESNAELAAGTDYVVTRYENNVKKGKNTAKAYVEGIGKYYGTNSGKFSILKTTSSTSKSTSSTSSSSTSSSSTSSSSSTTSSSSSASSSASSSSGNSSPGNASSGSSGRAVPVDTGDTGIGDATGTIEGTTDNYVIKITKTDEADAAFAKALSDKYGDAVEGYRDFAMDISLYDSTGEHKIEDPQGIAVTLTVPIPEDLALYGGNNKVAAVDHSGKLENLNTRYSMIDGAPCATFTATHFSPYGFYVDLNNLSAGDLDNTPKTGDPISPKWVIAIGLAALSIFLFLKKDHVPNAAKA